MGCRGKERLVDLGLDGRLSVVLEDNIGIGAIRNKRVHILSGSYDESGKEESKRRLKRAEKRFPVLRSTATTPEEESWAKTQTEAVVAAVKSLRSRIMPPPTGIDKILGESHSPLGIRSFSFFSKGVMRMH